MPRNSRGPSSSGPVQNVIHTKWEQSRQFLPATSPLHKGFFKLETLENATERLLAGRDPVIGPAVRKVLGDIPLSGLLFDLVWEGANRLVFVVTAINRRNARAQLGLVIARNHQEFGTAVKAGYDGLKELHAIAPSITVEPLQSGFFYLPDRHGRTEQGREVPAYFFAWPHRAVPLAVLREDQLGLSAYPAPKLLARADMEKIRAAIMELLLRAYRPETGSGWNLSALMPEDFLVWRSEAGRDAGAAITFCRSRKVRQGGGRYLLRVLQAAWPAKPGPFRLAPSDVDTLITVIQRAAGPENAVIWAMEALEVLKRHPGGGSDIENAVPITEAGRLALQEIAAK